MTKIETLDLRYLCRMPETHEATVSIRYRDISGPWLRLGEISLEQPNPSRNASYWELKAELGAALDSEHSTPYAVVLPLVGVVFEGISSHEIWLSAVVVDLWGTRFRIPPKGYDPRSHKDAYICDDSMCGKGDHIIIPDGFYVPPQNTTLYKEVMGLPVEIHIPTVGLADDDYHL